MTTGAVVGGRKRGVRIVMANMAPQTVDLAAIRERCRIGMAGIAGDHPFKHGGVHFVVEKVERVLGLFPLNAERVRKQNKRHPGDQETTFFQICD